jgi:hypothetical protein
MHSQYTTGRGGRQVIVDRIYQYLNETGKTIDEVVLQEATRRFQTVIARQLMEDREEKVGRLYVTRFSHPCARKGAYGYHGFEAEELQPRAKLNFLIGDVVELAIMATAKLAGCDIGLSNDRVELAIDRITISGYVDGLFSDGKDLYVAEFKKMSPYAYARVEKEGITDEWGYVSQVHAYMIALNITKAIFVVLEGQSGALNERVVQFDPAIWRAMAQRGAAILKSTPESLPGRAFGTVPTKNGKRELDLQCRYCGYKEPCWPGVQMVMKGDKPTWYVEEEKHGD